jgi:ABC-type nitrate/sulfonate/bicarbonate transport system permease component
MEASAKAITVTSALLWGGCMLLVGLINLADPSYGGEFLRVMSSVYPGADTARSIWRVLLGTGYGLVDGAVAGYLFVWLYRLLAKEHRSAH